MRAIDGDALKRKAQKVATEAWKMKLTASVETTLNQFIDWIDAQPTIEQKIGHWILKSHMWECDKCGCRIRRANPFKGNIWNYNYCPNCGAKMEVTK